MSTHALHSSSTSLSQYDSQSFKQKVKPSLAHTVKKAAAVTSIALGSTALVAGITLAAIASAGVALIPLAATAGSIALLSAGGGGGVVGGCFGLSCIKVNRAAEKVLKAANLVQKEAGKLEQIYSEQGPIAAALVEKLKDLKDKEWYDFHKTVLLNNFVKDLYLMDYYVGREDQQELIMYVFNIPKEYEKDYDLFKVGRYSKMSDNFKSKFTKIRIGTIR